MTAKSLLRDLAPPFVWKAANAMRGRLAGRRAAYDSYAEALAASGGTGYNVEHIGASTVAEFADEAARVQARLPLADHRTLRQLAAVWRVRDALKGRPLRVVDLGGQTGVHFHRIRPHLPDGAIAQWDVCETPAIVRHAADHAVNGLRFFAGLDALPTGDYDLAFSSGTLQALPEPWEACRQLGARAHWMLLDRMPLGPYTRDRLMVLRDIREAFQASLPLWFFAEATWLEQLKAEGWTIVLRWALPEESIDFDGASIVYSGLLLERR